MSFSLNEKDLGRSPLHVGLMLAASVRSEVPAVAGLPLVNLQLYRDWYSSVHAVSLEIDVGYIASSVMQKCMCELVKKVGFALAEQCGAELIVQRCFLLRFKVVFWRVIFRAFFRGGSVASVDDSFVNSMRMSIAKSPKSLCFSGMPPEEHCK